VTRADRSARLASELRAATTLPRRAASLATIAADSLWQTPEMAGGSGSVNRGSDLVFALIPRPAGRRRGGRAVEGARLESVYTGNRIVGSNPTPSAIHTFSTTARILKFLLDTPQNT
jgi:hypothetical protein